MTTLSILRAAAEAPGRVALVVDGVAHTYAALAAEVAPLVAWLGDRGVDPSTPRVALVGDVGRSSLTLLLALIESGVPALLIHPRSTAAERRRQLAETGTEVLLEPPAPGSLPAVKRAVGPQPTDDRRALAIVRTAGSAGRPKWVVLSRRAFVSAAAASTSNLGWRDDDRWLLSLPIAHVGGLSILVRCLLARRAVVVEAAGHFDAAAIAEVIDGRRVTLVSLVPTMLRRLLELQCWQPPQRLRAILVGGAATPPELLVRAADRRWPVLTTYGLTEACSQVATQRFRDLGRRDPARFTDCGEPVDGMEVRIRDGAIEVRGPSLMTGYLPAGEPPFDPEGWLATGDLGFLDAAGRLHVTGRRDDVIVSGGENVHPAEVEPVLEEHPAIGAACVFGVDDPEWGQAVAAALQSAAPPPDAELARFCAERLAPHQRPRRIAWLETLPRTVVGKLDRREAARAAAPHLRDLVRDE